MRGEQDARSLVTTVIEREAGVPIMHVAPLGLRTPHQHEMSWTCVYTLLHTGSSGQAGGCTDHGKEASVCRDFLPLRDSKVKYELLILTR